MQIGDEIIDGNSQELVRPLGTRAAWALALVALAIASVPVGILIAERREPPIDRAIRLVQEGASRKQNFTVQQFLYTTVYDRGLNGRPVRVQGWRAWHLSEGLIAVAFSYSDESGEQVALWEVNLDHQTAEPRNDEAGSLVWR